MPPKHIAWIGALLVVLSSVAFSGKAILAKVMYRDGLSPIGVLALRMSFAAPVYACIAVAVARGAPRLTSRDAVGVLLLGSIGYYGSSLGDFWGLTYISAGLERLILFTYPTLVLLLSAAWLRQPIRRHQAVALGVSYLGIAAAFASEVEVNADGVLIGSALVFGSAVTYAAYIVGSTRYIRRLGVERFTSYALLVAAAFVLTHFTFSGESLAGHPPRVYALGAAMALFATVLPTFALAYGIRAIGPGPSAILGTVGPVSTLFLAHFILGEPLSALQIVGAALVLAGASIIAARAGRPTVE